MSAILTFLGGSAFRMVFGEISAYFKHKQEMKAELAHMEAQGKLDAAQHERNMTAIKLQADLGVQTIRVQSDADVSKVEAEAFRESMIRASVPTGIEWVDAWNASVRPAFATLALWLWLAALYKKDWMMSEWDLSMLGAVAGFYFADRSLRKMGK